MINGDINDFIEKLTYGDEIIFTYHGKKYFIQGFETDGKLTLYLDLWEPPGEDYVWVGVGTDKNYPVEEFLSAPIWDGRTFMEIESEVEWVDE